MDFLNLFLTMSIVDTTIEGMCERNEKDKISADVMYLFSITSILLINNAIRSWAK